MFSNVRKLKINTDLRAIKPGMTDFATHRRRQISKNIFNSQQDPSGRKQREICVNEIKTTRNNAALKTQECVDHASYCLPASPSESISQKKGVKCVEIKLPSINVFSHSVVNEKSHV